MKNRSRLLLVDDEECIRESLVRILHYYGFAVETAVDVPTALEKMAAQRFDLLLTDLRMTGPQDGVAVIEFMHKINPDTVAILMSGNPDSVVWPQTCELTARHVLRKPLDIPLLVQTLKDSVVAQEPAGQLRAS